MLVSSATLLNNLLGFAGRQLAAGAEIQPVAERDYNYINSNWIIKMKSSHNCYYERHSSNEVILHLIASDSGAVNLNMEL